MSRWCVVTLCLVAISTASSAYHSARGYENEQFQSNQQFQGQQGMQWSKTRVTPNLVGMVQQGLGMLQYDASNIRIQHVRQRVMGNGLDYRVGFQNPMLQQNCIFQISYCGTCSATITPLTPACSSPCPGQVCRVDKSLRNLDRWFRSHRKSWQDRKYDEQDYESHSINNSLDEFNGGNGMPGVSGIYSGISPRVPAIGNVYGGYGGPSMGGYAGPGMSGYAFPGMNGYSGAGMNGYGGLGMNGFAKVGFNSQRKQLR